MTYQQWLTGFLEQAGIALVPNIQNSAVSITIYTGKVDPKLAMELGATILFEKPIILLVPDPATPLPRGLRRIADHIVYGDPSTPEVQARLNAVLNEVLPTTGEQS